jgi:hypothetical protein
MNRLSRSWFKRSAVVAVVAAAPVLFVGLAVFVAFVLMYGVDTNETQRVSGGGTQAVSIALTEFDVTPGTLAVDSGTHLVLDVVNRGDQAHDLAVDGAMRTKKLNAGESQRLDLGLVSDGLHMSCTQSLHEFLGMKLHIQVVQPHGNPTISSTMLETPPPTFSGTVKRHEVRRDG